MQIQQIEHGPSLLWYFAILLPCFWIVPALGLVAWLLLKYLRKPPKRD
jgi:hypothetical protein